MEPQVTFVYKDGFRKQYSRKVAEVLEKLGRGKIEGDKPAVKVEASKAEPPKHVEPEKVEEVFKPVAPPVEPAKRRGRPPKA